ncbi:DUF3531 family protein [Prochlorococcus sp. MIT 1341]|uniref:DUF3531 family protein n=1 Tax=Prochlorococcus sp. MIT 1341 TaxID=3096221 RepID=UPI002A762114|nr:DUF3531 family protein [Prochlorococcus sp. MIT 1341]
MQVTFREVDPFNCWLWLRFAHVPSHGERKYLDGILDSWYVIGRLGGFNAENLQAHQESNDLSFMNYDNDQASLAIPALMHNLGQVEYKDSWARFWVDFGTCDSISIDILINLLSHTDSQLLDLEEIVIGGVNESWDIDEHPDAIFEP